MVRVMRDEIFRLDDGLVQQIENSEPFLIFFSHRFFLKYIAVASRLVKKFFRSY